MAHEEKAPIVVCRLIWGLYYFILIGVPSEAADGEALPVSLFIVFMDCCQRQQQATVQKDTEFNESDSKFCSIWEPLFKQMNSN